MKRLIGLLLVMLAVLFVMSTSDVRAQPCNGDFNCDGDVDGSDASLFRTDFGRGGYSNPCDPCFAASPPARTGQTTPHAPDDDGTYQQQEISINTSSFLVDQVLIHEPNQVKLPIPDPNRFYKCFIIFISNSGIKRVWSDYLFFILK